MIALVLGASGMLGHQVLAELSRRLPAYGTVRSGSHSVEEVAPAAAGIVEGVAATDFDSVIAAVASTRPDVIVNCIGIVKQLGEANDPLPSIVVNALFPHRLAQLAETAGARLIHISTDCVFSGARGHYAETDNPDPVDLYGRTKLLGEVSSPSALTIRTSIIGHELAGAHGLLEWFLAQQGGRVRGFRRAVFSGWSTPALARALGTLVEDHRSLSGLWHVAAEPIDKYELLTLVRDAFGVSIEIEPDDELVIDRSLDGSRFEAETGVTAPSWPDMIGELALATGGIAAGKGVGVADR